MGLFREQRQGKHSNCERNNGDYCPVLFYNPTSAGSIRKFLIAATLITEIS